MDLEAAFEQWKQGEGAEVFSALTEAKSKSVENKALIKVSPLSSTNSFVDIVKVVDMTTNKHTNKHTNYFLVLDVTRLLIQSPLAPKLLLY